MVVLLQSSREHKTTSTGSCVSSTYSVCDRATLLLKSLHWLPVQQSVQYKIAVITPKSLSTSVPPYIDELLKRQVTTRSLRSTDAPPLCAVDTHWDSQASVTSMWRLRTSGTHYRMIFLTPVRCQASVLFYCCILVVSDCHSHYQTSGVDVFLASSWWVNVVILTLLISKKSEITMQTGWLKWRKKMTTNSKLVVVEVS